MGCISMLRSLFCVRLLMCLLGGGLSFMVWVLMFVIGFMLMIIIVWCGEFWIEVVLVEFI